MLRLSQPFEEIEEGVEEQGQAMAPYSAQSVPYGADGIFHSDNCAAEYGAHEQECYNDQAECAQNNAGQSGYPYELAGHAHYGAHAY